MMIRKWTPNKYPNLSLFLSEDKLFWYSQRYYFQFIIHMEEEKNVMMHNITPVLTFKYGDYGKTYFHPEAVEAAKYDYWYDTLKRVMCKIDENMVEEEEYDVICLNISLEFSKNTRKKFLPLQKQMITAPPYTPP